MPEQITPTPQGIDAFIEILRKHVPAYLIKDANELLLETDEESEQLTRALGIIEYIEKETELEPIVRLQLLACLSSLRSSVEKKSQLDEV